MSENNTAITTGISIKPKLLRAAKQKAKSLDISLSKLICQALTAALESDKGTTK